MSAVALLLLALGTLTQALLQGAVVPDLDLVGRMGLAALGIAAPLATVVGGVTGAAVAGERLRAEGAWLAMRSLGVRPARLAGEAAVLGLATALLVAVGMHGVEPRARALLRDARVAAIVRVDPVQGRTVRLGSWSVAVDQGRLHFVGSGAVGSAARWRLVPADAGVVAELEEVRVRDPDRAWSAAAATVSLPVRLPGTSGKVHVSERDSPDLAAWLRLHPGDVYERWILWKRSLIPVAAGAVAVAAMGLCLGRGLAVAGAAGGLAFGLWALIRICDGAIRELGAAGATAVVLGLVGTATLSAWRRVA